MTVGRGRGAWDRPSPSCLSGLPPAPAGAPLPRPAAGPAGIGPSGIATGAYRQTLRLKVTVAGSAGSIQAGHAFSLGGIRG